MASSNRELVQAVHDLLQALAPVALAVEDESAVHAGHAGAGAGAHLRVKMVSARFAGMPRVARHRLVYDALAGLMPARIHALALELLAPDEAP